MDYYTAVLAAALFEAAQPGLPDLARTRASAAMLACSRASGRTAASRIRPAITDSCGTAAPIRGRMAMTLFHLLYPFCGDGFEKDSRQLAVGSLRHERYCQLPTADCQLHFHVRNLRSLQFRHRRAGGSRGAEARDGRDGASRPGRRGLPPRRRTGPRQSPPEHHRSSRRPPAHLERGRNRLDHLQRRDLQLSRTASRSSKRAATASGPPATRKPFSIFTRSTARLASSTCAACSPSRCGTAASGGCCWRATASA